MTTETPRGGARFAGRAAERARPVGAENGSSGENGENGEIDLEQRKWAFFAHLSAFAGLVIPLGNLLGPLIVWQMKRYEMPFVSAQAKEALNFQITATIVLSVCAMLVVVIIGLLLLPVVGLGVVALTIIAAVNANEGKAYRYPFSWRLIK